MNTLLTHLRTLEAMPVAAGESDLAASPENAVRYLAEQISGLADEVLISPKGHCMWNEIEHLRVSGFPVECVESDRFGWLVARIWTSKGCIYYG